MAIKEMMAKRAAEEIVNGNVVNLGFGIPQKVVNYIPDDMTVFIHAENGILGAGPAAAEGFEDADVVDSGCVAITTVPGASFFDSADSFALIRSGCLDITILGALEIGANGDLANWMVPGGKIPGMGGAMDLAKKAKRVIAVTTHTDKNGNPKLKGECELPLTADNCVSLIITDIAVMKVTERGYLLTELFDGHTVDEVIEKTDADVEVADDIRIIRYN
ncbi:3-oxoacid CoA-transferase subunit B [Brotomerdimonas butyrica]|uniref:3-oxoacid CoA-transferase subunit B n=1 Tax=Brotomerdimonas butyrica TaxID=2981721 RepID=UPI0021CF7AC1|nr:3-oxoacid CoA-transferase subunit B [Brotomerdimonas butyrica]MCU6755319.1 3-oxoacid CoA-transferase subunit B [Brotomerdimonas butyrica]